MAVKTERKKKSHRMFEPLALAGVARGCPNLLRHFPKIHCKDTFYLEIIMLNVLDYDITWRYFESSS